MYQSFSGDLDLIFLVTLPGADKDIRDYSGRRFKHYLGIGDQLIRSKISKTHMCVN